MHNISELTVLLRERVALPNWPLTFAPALLCSCADLTLARSGSFPPASRLEVEVHERSDEGGSNLYGYFVWWAVSLFVYGRGLQ